MSLLKGAIKKLTEVQADKDDDQRLAIEVFKRMNRIFDKIEDVQDVLERASHALEQSRREMRALGLGRDLEAVIEAMDLATKAVEKVTSEMDDYMPGLEMQANGE